MDNVQNPPYLTAAQIELLAILSEELGEAQGAIGKILRHGYNSANPDDDRGITNRESLQVEIGEVMCALDLLCVSGDLDINAMTKRSMIKRLSIGQWMHHNVSKPKGNTP